MSSDTPPSLIQRREVLLAIAIVICSFCFKVGFVFWATRGDFTRPIFPDENAYYIPAAQEIAKSGFSFFSTERSLWNGPLNPLWIYFWNEQFGLIKILNAALVSLSGFLLWLMARRLSTPAISLIALAAFSLHFPIVLFSPTMLSEPLFLTLIIAAQACFVLNQRRIKLLDFFSGILLALATFTRPTTQLLPFFLIGLCLLVIPCMGAAQRQFLRGTCTRFSVLMCGFLLMIVPYVVKNYIQFGRPNIANGFGAVLYLGNDLRKDGDEPLYFEMGFDTQEVTREYAHLDSEGDKRLVQAGLESIKAHPIDSLGLWIRKAGAYIFGSSSAYFHPYRHFIRYMKNAPLSDRIRTFYEFFSLCLVASFALWGLLKMPMAADIRIYLGGFFLYLVLLHALTFPIQRLAIPLYPILCLFACGGLQLQRKWPALVLFCSAIFIVGFLPIFSKAGTVSSRYVSYFSAQREIDLKPYTVNDIITTEHGSYIAAGKNPFLAFRFDSVPRAVNQVIFCEIELLDDSKLPNTKPYPQMFLYWSNDAEGHFTRTQIATLPLYKSKQSIIYSFGLPWKAEHVGTSIAALRLNLPAESRGVEFRVKMLRVAK